MSLLTDPIVDTLLAKYPLISDQIDKNELRVILLELSKVINRHIPGDLVEFGCYEGTTSLFISRLLTILDPTREFHVYDSFLGLPDKSIHDSSPAGTQFIPGELAASKKTFVENYKRANLKLPHIHKAWFEDLTDANIPEHIAFAFLDGDYYSSISTSLKLIEPKLSKGAVIVVDDYSNTALPGAYRAVNDWCTKYGLEPHSKASVAIVCVETTPR